VLWRGRSPHRSGGGALAVRKRGEGRMQQQYAKSGEPLGPIGDKILLENEHIRVWSVALGPKGRQPWHKQHLPYLIVPLTESEAEMHFEDGTWRRITDKIGEVKWRGDPGPVHELYNLLDKDFLSILVEIKGASPET
jgi:beta-alanine degradation protein BauB